MVAGRERASEPEAQGNQGNQGNATGQGCSEANAHREEL